MLEMGIHDFNSEDGSALLQRVIERMCDVKLGSTQKGPEEL